MKNTDIAVIEARLGYEFRNKELLRRAFTHSSYSNEHKGEENNERLEFLGDAALGYVIGLYLYETYPSYREGQLTKIRAAVVDRTTISSVVDEEDFIQYVRTGGGNAAANLKNSVKAKCDLFEAIIGAILIDSGDIKVVSEFILRHLEQKIGARDADYKSKLLEQGSQRGFKVRFEVRGHSVSGDNDSKFLVALFIDDKQFAVGSGSNIKSAEQDVCKKYFLSNK